MKMRLEEGFTVGCDPEFFIHNEKKEVVSAVGLFPGTKQEPFKVIHGAVQVDGMAAEINTDPVTTWEDFNRNIDAVMEQLLMMLPSGYGFLIEPSVHFSQKVLDATPDYAKELGCDPDFNAWTGETNPYPENIDPTLRCAGGHIHTGWRDGGELDEKHISHCRDLAKQYDYFLGGWSLRIDSDVRRRQLYGKAGAFRPKPYGMEYRVLSNAWLTSVDRRLAVWNRICCALREMRRYNLPELNEESNELLIQYINTGKKPEKLVGIKYPLQSTDTYFAMQRFGRIV